MHGKQSDRHLLAGPSSKWQDHAQDTPDSNCHSQYIHALGGGELLVVEDWKELIEAGYPPEQDIVTKHFCYFGPVPDTLYEQIRDEHWRKAFQSAAEAADAEVKGDQR